MREQIVILDFGSQYTQVIARRIREAKVFSRILPYHTPAAEIAALNPKGIILSGGPQSVYSRKAPLPDKKLFDLGVPILGICFGFQVMGMVYGGVIEKIPLYQYITMCVTGIYKGCTVHAGVQTSTEVSGLKLIHPQKGILCNDKCSILGYANHCDQLVQPPPNFKITVRGPKGSIEGIEMAPCEGGCRVGVQFHPEGSSTTHFMIKKFVLHCIDRRAGV